MYQITAFGYEILSQITLLLGNQYEGFRPRAEEIVKDTEGRMRSLAQKVLDKEIDIKDVPKFLEQELSILKTEALEVAIAGVSVVDETWNKIAEKFQSVLKMLMNTKDAE